jgi:hypothetical protein
MKKTEANNRSRGSRKRAQRWSLLVLLGLPLLVLHVGLLVERAMHRESLDATVIVRWVWSVVLLLVLKRATAGNQLFRSPSLGIATVLIFVLIHAPVIAPEPGLPLAAAGLGIALWLAVEGGRGNPWVDPTLVHPAQPTSSAWSPFVSRKALKGRAPPIGW